MIKKLAIILGIVLMFATVSQAVDLQWDVNTDNPTGYIVYFNEQGDTDTPFNTAPIAHPTNTVTIDDGYFTPGVTYEFWVTAYNSRGESGNSNVVTNVVTPFTPPAENLPVILNSPTIPSTMQVM